MMFKNKIITVINSSNLFFRSRETLGQKPQNLYVRGWAFVHASVGVNVGVCACLCMHVSMPICMYECMHMLSVYVPVNTLTPEPRIIKFQEIILYEYRAVEFDFSNTRTKVKVTA